MKFSPILFLGICISQWTTSTSASTCGEPFVKIENGVLKEVNPHNKVHLDLSGCGITRITDNAFDTSTNVISLFLSNNKLTAVGPVFSKMKNLKSLYLGSNKLSYFFQTFKGLNHLMFLDISENPITNLQKFYFSYLPNTTRIYVGAHEIFKKVSSTSQQHTSINLCKTDDGLMKSLEQLEGNEIQGDCREMEMDFLSGDLDLCSLGLEKFEHGWYKLQNDSIHAIALTDNEITEIPSELLNDLPANVHEIDLGYNGIKALRKGIIINRNIKAMTLDYNFISIIEESAFENTDLLLLSLKGNRLNNLDIVEALPATLETLELSQNSFPIIPANKFRGLGKLESLMLDTCRIRIIEAGAFDGLENLSALRLDYNRISQLKPGIFRGLRNMENIDLSMNRIEKISQGVFSEFVNSKKLIIGFGNNRIDTIEAGSFSDLRIDVLELASNKITEKSFAKGAFNASNIQTIILRRNLISEINDSITEIPVVEVLDLKRNNITSIKGGTFEEMPHVRRIDLSENPLNRLENDDFRGLSSENVVINIDKVPLHFIEAGVFGKN